MIYLWFISLLLSVCDGIPIYSQNTLNRLQASYLEQDQTVSIPLSKRTRTPEQSQNHLKAVREHHAQLLELDSHLSVEEQAYQELVEEMSQPQDIPIKFNTFSLWIGKLGVGTPVQELDVVFDTGSSQLWVNSDSCTSLGCQENNQFITGESSTYQDLGLDMEVKFGTGIISGPIVSETVTIGGVSVKNQVMGVITQEDGEVFTSYSMDGILGLSFKALSSLNDLDGIDYVPLLQQIREQDVTQPKMSFYFNGDQSRIAIGSVPHKYYHGDLQFIDVSRRYYWELLMEDIKVGGERLNVCPEKGCRCVIDSGTSFLTGPKKRITKILKMVSGGEDCEVDQLPEITYMLKDSKGSYEYTLYPDDYMVQDGGSSCIPAMMGLNVNVDSPLWILGDVFMEKYFTVFSEDDGNGQAQIGLAPIQLL